MPSAPKAERLGVLCHPTLGGSSVVACELAIAMAARGWSVTVFAREEPARLRAFREAHGTDHADGSPAPNDVRFVACAAPAYPLFESPPHDLALCSQVLAEHEREPFDVLHAHYALPHAALALFARSMMGARSPAVVATLHGTDIALVGADPAFTPLVRWTLRNADAVTAVSAALAHATHELVEGTTAPRDPAPGITAPTNTAPTITASTETAPTEPAATITSTSNADAHSTASRNAVPHDPDLRSPDPSSTPTFTCDVVPNWVDAVRLTARAQPRPDPPRFVHVSNFRAVKDAPLVVEAFAALLQEPAGLPGDLCTDLELWMVGDGPERAVAERAADAAGIAGRVRWWGATAQPEALVAGALGMVLPSVTEGFGLAALEALALGVVPIVSAVGGLPEVVTHGVTGWLVEPPDPSLGAAEARRAKIAAFASSLRTVCVDVQARQRMARAARQDAADRFPPDTIMDRYEAVYRRAQESRRRNQP